MSEQKETVQEELEGAVGAMSEHEENEQSEELEGAVGGIDGRPVVIAVDPPAEDIRAHFPIMDVFPSDNIEKMEMYQETLMKFLYVLRDMLRKTKDEVRRYAEETGKPWDEYVRERRGQLNLNRGNMDYMIDWEEEDYLPEIHSVRTQMQFVHLCRWTLHRKIEMFYKENRDVPRREAHVKHQNPENFPAYDADSTSHVNYVIHKGEDDEFLEKGAIFAFNRLGFEVLNENQIRSLERAVGRMLGEESLEFNYARTWTEAAIRVTLETADQTLADVPSIPLDSSRSATEDLPATPHPSYADPETPSAVGKMNTLSGITALSNDLSQDDPSIDQSEDLPVDQQDDLKIVGGQLEDLPVDRPKVLQVDSSDVKQAEALQVDPSIVNQAEALQADPSVANQAEALQVDPSDNSQPEAKVLHIDPSVVNQVKALKVDPTAINQAETLQVDPSVVIQTEAEVLQANLPAVDQPSGLQANLPVVNQPEVLQVDQPADLQDDPSVIDQPADLQVDIPVVDQTKVLQQTDQSEESSSIEQSEETGGLTAECTEDDATTPEEDQTHRRKLYTHKTKPKNDDDGNVADTE